MINNYTADSDNITNQMKLNSIMTKCLNSANMSYPIYIIPDTEETHKFAALMNDTWVNSGSVRNAAVPQTIYLHDHLDFIFLDSELRLEEASNLQPVHIALVFGDHPLTNTYFHTFHLSLQCAMSLKKKSKKRFTVEDCDWSHLKEF